MAKPPTNRAAWLNVPKEPFTISAAPTPEPRPHELILRSHAFALNPVDAAMAKRGLLITSYPTVIGCDVAGIVHAIGSAVTRFRVGDRVIACSDDIASDFRTNRGCFQLYCAVPEGLSATLPDAVGFAQGCVLPLALCTAATSLFQKGNLGLPFPQLKPERSGKVLVVWGGSSSVGSCAIQMARAAGFDVAATCSERNFGYCREIGAEWVFDHGKEGVVEEIVEALEGRELVGVFDAVFPQIKECGEVAHRLKGVKKVATVLVGPPAMVVPEGTVPEGVEVCYCKLSGWEIFGNGSLTSYAGWGSSLKNDDVGPAVLGDWLSAALADGSMKCKPDPNVVGKGLEALQAAVELMEKGVSAEKLVVEIL